MNGVKSKVCSFIGHRKIQFTTELRQKIRDVIENLILNHDVSKFLFGSRSEFNFLCHEVVGELKSNYPFIKRVFYGCGNESCVLESERCAWGHMSSFIAQNKTLSMWFDYEVGYGTKYVSGRASYIERNKAMINDSDYCVFFYDEKYIPQKRKISNRVVGFYQPQSGTRIAYIYAIHKEKKIINLFKQ